MLIAALCNLQIRIVAAGGQGSCALLFRYQSVNVLKMKLLLTLQHLLYGFHDGVVGGGSENRVYLRNLVYDFLLVTLSQTAGHNQGLTAAGFAVLRHLQNRVDAFFLGVIDKAAGIDDNYICLCLIVGEGKAFFTQKTNHHLRIHKIFITAKGYK